MKKIFLCVGMIALTFLLASNTVHANDNVNTRPEILLLGANPTIFVAGSVIPNLAAQAIDLEDGNISYKIKVTSTSSPLATSEYVLTYMVVDSHGLAANPATRTVRFLGIGGGNQNEIATSETTPKSPAPATTPTPVVLIDRSAEPAQTAMADKKETPSTPDLSSVDITAIGSSTADGDAMSDTESRSTTTGSSLAQGLTTFSNAALATLPNNASEALTCLFLVLLVLALVYIGSNIVVNAQNVSGVSEKNLRKRKIGYFMVGVVIGLVIAGIFRVTCLYVPLVVVLIALAIWYAWFSREKTSSDQTHSVPKNLPTKQMPSQRPMSFSQYKSGQNNQNQKK